MFKDVLTNPSEHKPDDFIYLVHGLLPYDGNEITPEDVGREISIIKTPNEFYRASMIGRMNEASAKQRLGWCGGELYRMFTFGDVGLILNPASDENIKIAWYCGLGSPNEPEKLRSFVERYKYRIVEPLCIFTKSTGLPDDILGDNEIIIEGDPATEIQGVFYRNSDQAYNDARMVQDVASEILQSNLPIIQLPNIRISTLPSAVFMIFMAQRARNLQDFINSVAIETL